MYKDESHSHTEVIQFFIRVFCPMKNKFTNSNMKVTKLSHFIHMSFVMQNVLVYFEKVFFTIKDTDMKNFGTSGHHQTFE